MNAGFGADRPPGSGRVLLVGPRVRVRPVEVALKRDRLARMGSIFDPDWQLTKHASTPVLIRCPDRLGAAVETAFFKHVFTRFYSQTPRFAYWRDRRGDDYEVDIIAELGDRLVPFEVKYQDAEITPKRLKGLRQLIEKRKADQAYVITQRWKDLGLLPVESLQQGGSAKCRQLACSKSPAARVLLAVGLRRPPKPLRRAISARIGRPRFVRLLKWLGKENGE